MAGLGEWMDDGDEGWGMLLMDGELRRGFGWRGGVSLSLSLSPTRTLMYLSFGTAVKSSHAGFIHQQKAARLEAICSRQCSIT